MSDDRDTSRDLAERRLAKEAGARLMWVRKLSGKTQKEVADAVGCSQGEWSRWEAGLRKPPDPTIMLAACRRLRVSMDYIYRGMLIGVHPGLAAELLKHHSRDLEPPPIYTGWDTDMDRP